MSPPEHAVVVCVDEKSQMQALDRTQPLLPMRPGTPERRTHDYVRHGTSSLFAALMVKTGVVLGECHQRHRHQEFLKFLNAWASGDPLADWNDDGTIDTEDFTAYLNDWAAGC